MDFKKISYDIRGIVANGFEIITDRLEIITDKIRPKDDTQGTQNLNHNKPIQSSISSHYRSKEQQNITDEEMVKSLKILLSKPMDSSYSEDNLKDFLDEIWNEECVVSRNNTFRNYYISKKGVLESLRNYCIKKDVYSIKNCINFIRKKL
jgi:hypothetical protein